MVLSTTLALLATVKTLGTVFFSSYEPPHLVNNIYVFTPSNRKLGEFGAIFLDSGFRNSNQCVVFFWHDNFTLAKHLSSIQGV